MRITYNAPVILTFVLLSLLVLGVDSLVGGTLSAQYLVAPGTFQLTALSSWTGSVTHILGHAGMTHWMGNMTFILLLGPLLEEKYGSFALVVMIVVSNWCSGKGNSLNACYRHRALCGERDCRLPACGQCFAIRPYPWWNYRRCIWHADAKEVAQPS